jgi:hypothetical protein
MPNTVLFAAGTQGNSVQIGSPNGETGLSVAGPSGRADIRFDGALKLVAGPAGNIPPSTNGLSISTAGNVTVGNYSGSTARLMAGGEGGIAVSGSTISTFSPAMRGVNTGNGNGVEGTSTNGAGIAGTSGNGSGVFASSTTGFALDVQGNARQSLNKGGIVKAMALIRVTRSGFPTVATASVLRCYNSVNNTSNGNCGIGFGTVFTSFGVEVNFGFTINDRFVMVSSNTQNVVTTTGFTNSSTVTVLDSGSSEFFIFVF